VGRHGKRTTEEESRSQTKMKKVVKGKIKKKHSSKGKKTKPRVSQKKTKGLGLTTKLPGSRQKNPICSWENNKGETHERKNRGDMGRETHVSGVKKGEFGG